jgi:hypothetical protein
MLTCSAARHRVADQRCHRTSGDAVTVNGSAVALATRLKSATGEMHLPWRLGQSQFLLGLIAPTAGLQETTVPGRDHRTTSIG